MTTPCIATPASWLRLEQLHDGTLDDAERDAVTAHLERCAACAACAARIEDDARAPLPPLAASPTKATTDDAKIRRWRRVAPVLGGLALAATLVFAVGRAPKVHPVETMTRIKGGEVALDLVREREGVVAEAGGSYRHGDRFKAVVTCPPGMLATWDLVVFDEDGVSFPLEETRELACGNAVPLAGAFRLTGTGPVTVCLVWDAPRAEIAKTSSELLPRASCLHLEGTR